MALPISLGTQYRVIPGSWYGLTVTTRVPCFFARWMYFIATGWSLAGFDPKNTSRSVPNQSLYEHVDAATPSVPFIAPVDGEWHSQAVISTLLVPRNRATFCAT